MPIYEYEALDPGRACPACVRRLEVFQRLGEPLLQACPECGGRVRKVVSWCRAAVVERSEHDIKVEDRVKSYERERMWSHAAELADSHSEKTGDASLKNRALDDYKKAGYDVDRLTSSKNK